jgi:hypothetical protein
MRATFEARGVSRVMQTMPNIESFFRVRLGKVIKIVVLQQNERHSASYKTSVIYNFFLFWSH